MTGDSDAANGVTVNKTGDVVTSVEVANVSAKGTQTGGVTDADLPFDASGLTAMESTPGNYTLTFTYAANGTITVTCASAGGSGAGA